MADEHRAEIVLSGGNVITMEEPVAALPMDLAIADGKIVAKGQHGSLTQWIRKETTVLDVHGQTILPGLIDSHNHMIMFGQDLHDIDVSASKVRSIDELVRTIKEQARHIAPGKWVRGWGYNEFYLKEKHHPVRDDLDKASSSHPIVLIRFCRHVMVVNSLALKMAKISDTTRDPEGGKIGRYDNGQPNGILFELNAMNLVNSVIPLPDPETCAHFANLASQIYIKEGITLVTEAGAGWSGNSNEVAGFQIASKARDLPNRVSMGLMGETYKIFPKERGLGIFTGFGDDKLWIGPLKFVADGALSARTAALSEPYEGSNELGAFCQDPYLLLKRMEEAHRHGFQISVHAIGDRTIEMVVNAFKSILSKYPRQHRHRIEHVTVCRPDLLRRIKQLELAVVVQPAFLYYAGDAFIENLGEVRAKWIIPIKSLLKEGIVVAGSSDRPVAPGNPWMAIWAAVNRSTKSGKSIAPEENITIEEALKLYTINGAHSNFKEHRLGTISIGKLADLIVVEENPLEMSPQDLMNVRVSRTFIDGREIYKRGLGKDRGELSDVDEV
jgi:predicted amidohydrolase YtcJ